MPTKVHIVKALVFPVVIYGCGSWTIKKTKHRRIDAFELWYWKRLLKSPLVCKEIKPHNPKGNQSWIFIGRIDAEAEDPILWLTDAKIWLIGKDPNTGKDWRQEEKGPTEKEKVGWHHWLNGHEFKHAPGDGEGQGSLVCCSPRGCKESDVIEQLSNNKVLCVLSHPYLFLLFFYCEPLWNLHEASSTLKTLLNTSIRNAFSMLIRNAFSMLQRNTMLPVMLWTWTLMCHSKNFIYQQTWTSSTKVYGQGCAFGIKIWKRIKCP